MHGRLVSIFTISAIVLLTMPFFTGCEDKRTLFEHSFKLEILSSEGETDIRNISVSKDDDTVTVLETFYNQDDIWVGFELRGRRLIESNPAFIFSFNGTQMGHGAHGAGINDFDSDPETLHYILSPSSSFDVRELPDEFVLQFQVREQDGLQRVFDFDLPLQRSDKEVVIP